MTRYWIFVVIPLSLTAVRCSIGGVSVGQLGSYGGDPDQQIAPQTVPDIDGGAGDPANADTTADADDPADADTGAGDPANSGTTTGADDPADADTTTDADDDPNPGGEPIFHVFLLLGQSNMAGYPAIEDADRKEDDRIQVLGFDNCASTGRVENEWDNASPPLHACWSDAIGPGDYFAKTLIDYYPEGDTIGMVPCAIPGERIETFMKAGGSKYDWIIQRAKLAQRAGGVIDGMLFHQGESNNGDTNWPRNVNTFVEDLRTDLGLGDVPFLAGELLYTGGCAGHNTLIDQLPDVVTNAHVVSAEGLAVDPADTQYNLHFCRDAQIEFGKRYAEKMVEALGL